MIYHPFAMGDFMNNIQELRELVNPVFNTAKFCLEFDAENGDTESRLLLDTLGFESTSTQNAKQFLPPETLAALRRVRPVFSTYVESRFHSVNRLIASMQDRTVVDLPCGYTARGIKMSHVGREYYGFDLPAVIDSMALAVATINKDDKSIHYAAVDATNYETMEAPLSDTTAPLLITTEGLLMYFTQSELEEVFSNVRRLLHKHGGSWVLVDRTYYFNEQRIAEVILGDNPQDLSMFKTISAKGAGAMADIRTYNNAFFQGTDTEVRAFIQRMGFELREICMADYLPDHLVSLEPVPQTEPDVRDVFRTMFFWELTVKEEENRKTNANLPFALETSFKDGLFSVSIQGRMDTITAPELLQRFQELPGKAAAIEVNVDNMAYVSSAGLRVLLMMYKSIEDKTRFKMTGISDAVREILETTGFDQFLLG